ncbi:MAG: signal peptide peptidase SppA [Candidatus Aminicenantes bacterium]|nr:signal peptide peptidase SppA [Candidatus Aminicenantes bacterium]
MNKKHLIWLILITFFYLAACSPRINIDFLGQEKLQEVVLVESGAREKVLVIEVDGVISSESGGLFSREGNVVSSVYQRLEKAAADPLVKGVIVRLETPGGEVTSSDVLYHEIQRFRQKKNVPVVALMLGVAASGGYYVASACDTIIAHPTTLTGSIGVIAVFPEVEGLMNKVGVKTAVVKSGAMKDAGSPFRGMSEEEKHLFQKIIDEHYEKFLQVVKARKENGPSLEDLRKIADGRVYTAQQALDLGLIDKIGYFESALKEVLTRAGLKEARAVAYTYYPKKQNNLYASSFLSPDSLTKALEQLLPALKTGFYYLWLPGW